MDFQADSNCFQLQNVFLDVRKHCSAIVYTFPLIPVEPALSRWILKVARPFCRPTNYSEILHEPSACYVDHVYGI